MVKRLLFLFFLLPVSVFSQAYIPFAKNMIIYGASQLHTTATWGPIYFHRTEIYGDTIIGSYRYSKIYTGVGPFVNVGGIRNDTLNKKVYRYLFSTGVDKLLYDFNLSVGDTVNSSSGFGFYEPLIDINPPGPSIPPINKAWVFSIDSILMPHDGLYHRRFNFKANINGFDSLLTSELTSTIHDSAAGGMYGYDILMHSLIEGVGQMSNPISQHGTGAIPYEWGFGPLCSSINGVTIMNNFPWTPPGADATNCSSIFVGIEEENIPEDIIVYPNPTTGLLQIKTEHQIKSIEITDVLGKIILTSEIKNQMIQLDLSNHPSEIYFVKVIDDNGNFVVKKIVKE